MSKPIREIKLEIPDFDRMHTSTEALWMHHAFEVYRLWMEATDPVALVQAIRRCNSIKNYSGRVQ